MLRFTLLLYAYQIHDRTKKTGKKDASANACDLKTGGAPFESQLDH